MVDVLYSPRSVALWHLELTGESLDKPVRVGGPSDVDAEVEENLMSAFVLNDEPVESCDERLATRGQARQGTA